MRKLLKNTRLPILRYILFLFAIQALLSTVTLPATYYVSQKHPLASDSNEGTRNSPWLTIQHVANTVSPGDTIIVGPGSYGRLLIRNGGAPGQYLTYRA